MTFPTKIILLIFQKHLMESIGFFKNKTSNIYFLKKTLELACHCQLPYSLPPYQFIKNKNIFFNYKQRHQLYFIYPFYSSFIHFILKKVILQDTCTCIDILEFIKNDHLEIITFEMCT